jgi:hypothetical protein
MPNFQQKTQKLTSGGALSTSSNRTSLPVMTATASAPGCGKVNNCEQHLKLQLKTSVACLPFEFSWCIGAAAAKQ